MNGRTVCERCGAPGIEWHREEHEQRPNARVSSLRTQGAPITRIQAEMDLCTPLCRSCHMAVDGRGERLHQAAPYRKGQSYVDPKPCVNCGKLTKPTRRGRCNHCYIKHMGIR